jgi:hypothetical protein
MIQSRLAKPFGPTTAAFWRCHAKSHADFTYLEMFYKTSR